MSGFVDRLRDIVGDEHVLTDADLRAGYETDWLGKYHGLTPCVEIGWRLAKAHWGRGFAPEGALAVLGFAFEHVDLPNDEVVSFTTITNHRSRRVMEKIGLFVDPRREFDHPMTPGWWGIHHVVYSIDRPTWNSTVAR